MYHFCGSKNEQNKSDQRIMFPFLTASIYAQRSLVAYLVDVLLLFLN